MSYSNEQIQQIVFEAKRLYRFKKTSEPKQRVDFDGVIEEVIKRNQLHPTKLLKELVKEEWQKQRNEKYGENR